MCGIAGFSEVNERTIKIAPWLACGIEARGHQSWGVTNGVETLRYLGAIGDSWHYDWAKWLGPVSFHTRAASVGEVSLENCHPFEVLANDGLSRINLMHNGHISNHTELRKQWALEGQVDSQALAGHIVNGGKTKEVQGWGALVYWTWDRMDELPEEATIEQELEWIKSPAAKWNEPSLSFVKFNGADFSIAKLVTGEVVWASTKLIVEAACKWNGAKIKHFYEQKGDWEYRLEMNDETSEWEVMDYGTMPFGGRYGGTTGFCGTTSATSAAAHYGSNYSRNSRTEDFATGSSTGSSQFPTCSSEIAKKNLTEFGSHQATCISELGSPANKKNFCPICGWSLYTNKGTAAVCSGCFRKAIRKVIENHFERVREDQMCSTGRGVGECFGLVGLAKDVDPIKRWWKIAEQDEKDRQERREALYGSKDSKDSGEGRDNISGEYSRWYKDENGVLVREIVSAKGSVIGGDARGSGTQSKDQIVN